MLSLDRAVSGAGEQARPLPTVFPSFAARKMHFLPGELAMLAGPPGSGKSSMALWHATRWVAHHALKGMYFSADSSALVQASRALAMVSEGLSTDEAERRIEERDDRALETLHSKLDGLAWCFESNITYSLIEQEVLAFTEAWGELPRFVIIDNLFNVEADGDSEHTGLRKITENLLTMGRTLGTHVMALHHTSESHREDPCPPREAVHGKVSQTPYLVVTVGQNDGHRQPFCPVKNRIAKPQMVDKTGREATYLRVNTDNFHFFGA